MDHELVRGEDVADTDRGHCTVHRNARRPRAQTAEQGTYKPRIHEQKSSKV